VPIHNFSGTLQSATKNRLFSGTLQSATKNRSFSCTSQSATENRIFSGTLQSTTKTAIFKVPLKILFLSTLLQNANEDKNHKQIHNFITVGSTILSNVGHLMH
jgi:hypothetical protein